MDKGWDVWAIGFCIFSLNAAKWYHSSCSTQGLEVASEKSGVPNEELGAATVHLGAVGGHLKAPP